MVKSRFAVFWTIVASLALFTGLQARLLLPGWPALATWGLTAGLFALMLGPQVRYRYDPALVNRPGFKAFVWLGSILIGVWATFLFFSIPLDIGGLAAAFAGWAVPAATVLLGLAVFALLIGALGLTSAMSGPAVKEVTVPMAGLPKSLEGLRIVQLTDLHVGPTIQSGYVSRVVDTVLSLKPDLIAVTGDLADGTVEELAKHVAPLARLKAPLGVYFVTGNHEYYWEPKKWLEKVRELGWTALVDENRVVSRNGEKILVGGVADTQGAFFIPEHRSDAARAAATAEKTDLRLLLAHRPDSCEGGEKAGFDLQLSGHTHGGQFFPFSLLIGLFHRYPRGLNRHGKLWLYVSPGTGYWGPPNRFRVPSEITLLTLRKGDN